MMSVKFLDKMTVTTPWIFLISVFALAARRMTVCAAFHLQSSLVPDNEQQTEQIDSGSGRIDNNQISGAQIQSNQIDSTNRESQTGSQIPSGNELDTHHPVLPDLLPQVTALNRKFIESYRSLQEAFKGGGVRSDDNIIRSSSTQNHLQSNYQTDCNANLRDRAISGISVAVDSTRTSLPTILTPTEHTFILKLLEEMKERGRLMAYLLKADDEELEKLQQESRVRMQEQGRVRLISSW